MKTTIRTFQREFPRMRKLAAAGQVVIIDSEGQSFEFRARRKEQGVLGCMTGRAQLEKLRDGPVIPADEWGSLGS